MTVTVEQIRELTGSVYSESSDKIGEVGQVYLDDVTGAPSWVTVKTGLFGTSESFVPLEGARVDGDDVYVGFSEEMIKDAPRVDADGSITPEEEEQLYAYYNLSDSAGGVAGQDASQYATENTANPTGVNTSAGKSARDADTSAAPGDRTHERTGDSTGDDAMTRSEERLRVGTATREAGRARLRKYVTSETVTETVPVRREEVTVEREPITDANYDASQTGPAIGEEEHEVVLHEEVPVVEKDVVAVERVKLGTETKTDEVTVSEEVRNENIDIVEPDTATGDARDDSTER